MREYADLHGPHCDYQLSEDIRNIRTNVKGGLLPHYTTLSLMFNSTHVRKLPYRLKGHVNSGIHLNSLLYISVP